jgi:hypothetical protein
MSKVRETGGGDRLEVEAGGVLTIETGGALRGEAGATVDLPKAWWPVASTAYTLSESDAGRILRTSNGSAVTITVPPHSSVPFQPGTQISIAQFGAGQVTIAAGGGVTIRTPETLKLAKQYAQATLEASNTADEWILSGYLEAA